MLRVHSRIKTPGRREAPSSQMGNRNLGRLKIRGNLRGVGVMEGQIGAEGSRVEHLPSIHEALQKKNYEKKEERKGKEG